MRPKRRKDINGLRYLARKYDSKPTEAEPTRRENPAEPLSREEEILVRLRICERELTDACVAAEAEGDWAPVQIWEGKWGLWFTINLTRDELDSIYSVIETPPKRKRVGSKVFVVADPIPPALLNLKAVLAGVRKEYEPGKPRRAKRDKFGR